MNANEKTKPPQTVQSELTEGLGAEMRELIADATAFRALAEMPIMTNKEVALLMQAPNVGIGRKDHGSRKIKQEFFEIYHRACGNFMKLPNGEHLCEFCGKKLIVKCTTR